MDKNAVFEMPEETESRGNAWSVPRVSHFIHRRKIAEQNFQSILIVVHLTKMAEHFAPVNDTALLKSPIAGRELSLS
jgi:hypothetical protein